MLDKILNKLGLVRKSQIIGKLHYARSVGKRLDEHREVVQSLESRLDPDEWWHYSHLATQDDYLMRLYHMVYGKWPSDDALRQETGEVVRTRPAILGECGLPEYHCVTAGSTKSGMAESK